MSGPATLFDPGATPVGVGVERPTIFRPAPKRWRQPRPGESDCQRTIVEAAHVLGCRVLAIRPALNRRGDYRSPIQGDPGYPDLTISHPVAGVIYAELKRHPNRLEPAQARWAQTLLDGGADWRLVWVPEEMQAFIDDLTRWAGR